jgi:hypothetical protein
LAFCFALAAASRHACPASGIRRRGDPSRRVTRIGSPSTRNVAARIATREPRVGQPERIAELDLLPFELEFGRGSRSSSALRLRHRAAGGAQVIEH